MSSLSPNSERGEVFATPSATRCDFGAVRGLPTGCYRCGAATTLAWVRGGEKWRIVWMCEKHGGTR